MKLFSIILSILVAVISTVLYRDQIAHFASQIDTIDLLVARITDSYHQYYSSSSPPSTGSSSNPEDSADSLSPSGTSPASPSSHFYNPSVDSNNQEQHYTVTPMSQPRSIRKVLLATEQAEGAGARVRRSIGTPQLRNLSPFLMLDQATIGPGAGFPDHPHRGMETITYVLKGAIDHEDFAGNKGTIEEGDLQFMTAGKGIVHAEMPRQNPDGSPNVGLQLWVDLPQHLKSCDARYRDLRASEIPKVDLDDGKVHIKVISGQAGGVESLKDLAYTPVWWLDVEIKPGGKLDQALPRDWNAFAYMISGTAFFGGGSSSTSSSADEEAGKDVLQKRKVEQFNNCVLEREGDFVHVEVPPDAVGSARFVLIAGQVLDQPVVQYGPFVVSSQQEVRQAFFDYQTHSNGFERARDWESEIGKSMMA